MSRHRSWKWCSWGAVEAERRLFLLGFLLTGGDFGAADAAGGGGAIFACLCGMWLVILGLVYCL